MLSYIKVMSSATLAAALQLRRWFGDDDPVKAAALGLTSGRDRVKDGVSVLSSQHLCRLASACKAFMCTACTKIIAHVKDLMS